MEKPETIFFALFRGSESLCSSTEYFEEEKTLKDFYKWLQEGREEVIKRTGEDPSIQDIKIIRS